MFNYLKQQGFHDLPFVNRRARDDGENNVSTRYIIKNSLVFVSKGEQNLTVVFLRRSDLGNKGDEGDGGNDTIYGGAGNWKGELLVLPVTGGGSHHFFVGGGNTQTVSGLSGSFAA